MQCREVCQVKKTVGKKRVFVNRGGHLSEVLIPLYNNIIHNNLHIPNFGFLEDADLLQCHT